MEDTVVFLVYVLLCPLDFCVKSLDLVPFDLLVELHVRIYRITGLSVFFDPVDHIRVLFMGSDASVD